MNIICIDKLQNHGDSCAMQALTLSRHDFNRHQALSHLQKLFKKLSG